MIKSFDFGDGSGVFFTSDSHFNHERIIPMTNRPFANAKEMDKTMIENWNKVVGKNDIVFHLGDFCFGGPPKWREILEQLNGNIYLILGNHDWKNLKANCYPYFTDIQQQMRIQIDDWVLYLNHFPYLCYDGTWNLGRKVGQVFGHVHSCTDCKGQDMPRMQYLFPTQYDVGVDNNNFTPISWKEVKQIFETNIAKALENNGNN